MFTTKYFYVNSCPQQYEINLLQISQSTQWELFISIWGIKGHLKKIHVNVDFNFPSILQSNWILSAPLLWSLNEISPFFFKTFFKIKRFMINVMLQRKTSKFAIFVENKNQPGYSWYWRTKWITKKSCGYTLILKVWQILKRRFGALS